MYRTENIDVLGKVMPTLVFEPEGAGHGFQDSGNAERYREQPSEDAWAKAIGFLDGQLKRGKA